MCVCVCVCVRVCARARARHAPHAIVGCRVGRCMQQHVALHTACATRALHVSSLRAALTCSSCPRYPRRQASKCSRPGRPSFAAPAQAKGTTYDRQHVPHSAQRMMLWCTAQHAAHPRSYKGCEAIRRCAWRGEGRHRVLAQWGRDSRHNSTAIGHIRPGTRYLVDILDVLNAHLGSLVEPPNLRTRLAQIALRNVTLVRPGTEH